jgi:hypothetical protein
MPPAGQRPQPADQQPIHVPASRARRTSGSTPWIQVLPGERLPPELIAKLCIDPQGGVTSITVVSAVSRGTHDSIRRALAGWRYQPIVQGDRPVPACFATTLQVHHTR